MTQPTTPSGLSGLMSPAPDPATFPSLNTDHDSINLANWDDAENRHWSFWNMEKVGLKLVENGRGTVPVAALRPAPRDLSGVRVNLFGRRMSIDEWRDAVNSHGLIVVRGDEVLHEVYGNGMSMEDRHSIQSITKTTVCALIGALVVEGRIRLDARVGEYIPEIGSAYAAATVQDTLDMNVTNDFTEDYADPNATVWQSAPSSDWKPDPDNRWPGATRQFLASLTGADLRGSGETQYKSANTDVLQWAIENVTGRNYNDLVRERLWGRLGAGSSAFMTIDRTGRAMASGGLAITLRDLARYGQLWANRGVTRAGERLIPEAWVAQTMDASRGTRYVYEGFKYHNQIVTNGRVLFHGGWAGQFMWCDTATGLVIAFMSGYRNPAGTDEALMNARRELCEAITAAVT